MSGNTAAKKASSSPDILHNKLLLIFVPIMLIISIVGVFLIIKAANGGASAPVSSAEDYVYVLPIPERVSDETDANGKNPFSSTGVSPVALTGIMYNPDGLSYAILSSSAKSFVLTSGELIGDTGWTLEGITETGVTVGNGEITETLELDVADIPTLG